MNVKRFIKGHGFTLKGFVEVTVRDAATGKVLRHGRSNKIVDAGLGLARDLLGGGNYSPTDIAVGTDNTAPVAGDTTLGVEVFRKAITQIDFDPTAIVQFNVFLDAGDANGNTLEEAGLFNNAFAGDLFSRFILSPPIIKTAAITVTIQWSITVARA